MLHAKGVFEDSKWIYANIKELEKLDARKYNGPSAAKWVWGIEYCRTYVKKKFVIDFSIKSAMAYFLCDNVFEFYVNGSMISKDHKEVFADISAYLKKGENIIALKLYQTDEPQRFLSAIRGGIIIESEESKKEVLTDKSWQILRLCTYGEDKEEEGWYIRDVGANVSDERMKHLHEFSVHPSILRRSCCFEKEFILDKMPRKAVLRASAYGLWQPYVNGEDFDYRLMPGTMEGRKEYQEIDILDKLRIGQNILTIVLGNGWHNCQCYGILFANRLSLICEMEAEFEDGSKIIVSSDESWRVYASKVYEDDLQFGERFDSRIKPDCFNAETYENTQNLVRQDYPMMKVLKRISPVQTLKKDGLTVFDFGKNYSGRAKITVKNTFPGQCIILRYYEFINNDGELNEGTYADVYYPSDAAKGAKARYAVKNIDTYICTGAGKESYEPVFTYTGYRYIVVYGIETGQEYELLGTVIGAEVTKNADMDTSCGFIKELWDMAYQSWMGNIFSGPTDCPSREKNYWNGDMQIFAHTACWASDCSRILSVWTEYGRKIEYGIYGWEDEEYILPWVLFKFYADKSVLRNKYGIIKKLMKKRGVFDGVILPKNPNSPYCDHLTCGANIDKQLFSDLYCCYMLKIVSMIAEVIDEDSDFQLLMYAFERSKAEFLKRYLANPVLEENQGGIILAVSFGLVTGTDAEKAVEKLSKMIKKNKYHLATGFHSMRYILNVLCDYGYKDIAWELVKQTEYPSWRYIQETGATTFTENWEGQNTSHTAMSMNHFTLGAFTCWFYEYLGGIRVDKCSPGFSRIWLEPVFIKEVGDFAVKCNTIEGEVKTYWKFIDDNTVEYGFEIPVGINCTVKIDDKEYEFCGGVHEIRTKFKR